MVELALDLLPALPIVSGDRIQLQQVVLNLVTNAAEAIQAASPSTRRISLSTRLAHETPNGPVELVVTDTGPGLPSDAMEQVFEPFYSSKANGMGVGLSISRSIVTAHGGTLTAENGAEGGGRFRLSLPVVAE